MAKTLIAKCPKCGREYYLKDIMISGEACYCPHCSSKIGNAN